MSDPKATSPANGAASKTDIPQSSKVFSGAEKPARFRVVNSSPGVFWIDCQPPMSLFGNGLGLTFCQSDFGPEFGRLNPNMAERMAHNICVVLEALDAERRGELSVSSQLLQELRELVKMQKEIAPVAGKMLKLAAEVGEKNSKRARRGEEPSPEELKNLNDRMLDVARAFGIPTYSAMGIPDLREFVRAARRMTHRPPAAEQALKSLDACVVDLRNQGLYVDQLD